MALRHADRNGPSVSRDAVPSMGRIKAVPPGVKKVRDGCGQGAGRVGFSHLFESGTAAPDWAVVPFSLPPDPCRFIETDRNFFHIPPAKM